MARAAKKPEEESNVRIDLAVYHRDLWERFTEYAKTERDLDLPQNVRISPGFTEHGKSPKSKLQVQVIMPEATVDGNFEIVVRWAEGFDGHVVKDIAMVVPFLLNKSAKRDAQCRDYAVAWGLDIPSPGGLRAATIKRQLREFLDKLDDELGPYPHLGVRFDVLNEKRSKVVTDAKEKQTGRMHKVKCDKCGLIVRQSQKAMDDFGVAHCAKHGKMRVHYKEGEEPDETAPETPPAADQNNAKPQVAAE